MTGRHQAEALVQQFLAAPETIPAGRFEACGNGRIRCVLDGRVGRGVTNVDLSATYPERERGHRTLLRFFGDQPLVVEGPDTAPPPPRSVPPIHQFARWQIGCLQSHDWECTCGLRYTEYASLWRHIGAPRPPGWGRQDGINHALVAHTASPPKCGWVIPHWSHPWWDGVTVHECPGHRIADATQTTRPGTLNTGGPT